jgi:tetratricopeptide (TPR) repeat protein
MATQQAFGRSFGLVSWLLVCTPEGLSARLAQESPGPEFYWPRLHAAVARCDWRQAELHAELVVESSERGSESWLGGVAALAQIRIQLASPLGFEELAREALELVERVDQAPQSQTLSPSAERSAAQIEIALANAFQHRGSHAMAIVHLRRAATRLRSGRAESPDRPLAETLLGLARSLRIQGLDEQSRPLLEELRDRFEGSTESAIAAVLLQQGPEGITAYRGRYEGDAGHAQRMRVLWDMLPSARAEVANAFGTDAQALERVHVGTVDRLEGFAGLGAVTLTDPRQPEFSPVVVVFSRPLALRPGDMRETLVHELGHAALSLELGLAHEDLPDWLVEGAVQAVAAPWDKLADDILAHPLTREPQAFIADSFRADRLVDFSTPPCRRTASRAAGLGLWAMEKGILERGWKGLVPALRKHADVDAALEEAFGHLPPPQGWIEREIVQRLERRRAAALPDLRAMLAAHDRGPAEGLEFAERLLAGSPSPLARGLALWDRAGALEALGRLEEAHAAYEALDRDRSTATAYAEAARQGRIRCLLKLGREAQAERELVALERDAVTPVVKEWASDYLRDVGEALRK